MRRGAATAAVIDTRQCRPRRRVFVCQRTAQGYACWPMRRHVSLRLRAPPWPYACWRLQPASAAAQPCTTYRWVDAQGVVHYSDTPQPGAQMIQLPDGADLSRTGAASGGRPAGSRGHANRQRAGPYQSCAITQPAAEASFFAPDAVPVAVQLDARAAARRPAQR